MSTFNLDTFDGHSISVVGSRFSRTGFNMQAYNDDIHYGYLPPPAGYSRSQLIFDDKFKSTTLDSTKWIPQIADQGGIWTNNGNLPSPYSGITSGGFNLEYYDPYPQQGTNISGYHTVTGSGLKITATPNTHFSGYSWASGCITTHGKFTFAGGYLQVRAKIPDSTSGMWACIWCLEGGPEIDVQESGMLMTGVNSNDVMASHFFGTGGSAVHVNAGVDLSADYHVYGMEYRPGVSIKTYLDGTQIASWTQNIPSGGYTILLNLQVAGSQASAWHSTGATSGTFEYDVSEVQVYSLT